MTETLAGQRLYGAPPALVILAWWRSRQPARASDTCDRRTMVTCIPGLFAPSKRNVLAGAAAHLTLLFDDFTVTSAG